MRRAAVRPPGGQGLRPGPEAHHEEKGSGLFPRRGSPGRHSRRLEKPLALGPATYYNCPSSHRGFMSTDKKMDKKDLEKFKALLQVIRAKIAGDLKHLENDSLNINQKDASGDLSAYSFHMADMATDN